MQVVILEEHGYECALRGMAYSFKDRALETETWWDGQFERAKKRAPLLAGKGLGHDKFLEAITVYIDIEASRAFWSEFDTYRVGTTKQSESTMHTLSKRPPTFTDFEEGTLHATYCTFLQVWEFAKGDVNVLKMNLPEGFLQRRLVVTNYKVLRNIIAQREGHRLIWWRKFIDKVLQQVEHPELLV